MLFLRFSSSYIYISCLRHYVHHYVASEGKMLCIARTQNEWVFIKSNCISQLIWCVCICLHVFTFSISSIVSCHRLVIMSCTVYVNIVFQRMNEKNYFRHFILYLYYYMCSGSSCSCNKQLSVRLSIWIHYFIWERRFENEKSICITLCECVFVVHW